MRAMLTGGHLTMLQPWGLTPRPKSLLERRLKADECLAFVRFLWPMCPTLEASEAPAQKETRQASLRDVRFKLAAYRPLVTRTTGLCSEQKVMLGSTVEAKRLPSAGANAPTQSLDLPLDLASKLDHTPALDLGSKLHHAQALDQLNKLHHPSPRPSSGPRPI